MTDFNKDIFKKLCVISAPSGAGKTSLIKKICLQNSNISVCISHTTRNPRAGEEHGIDYFFINKNDFELKIKNESYLEYAKVHGNYYGTLIDSVVELLEKDMIVILEIDYQGAQIIKRKLPLSRNIFILPPSLDELEKRLRGRGTDKEDVILERLKNARTEINYAKDYDYTVVNNNFESAENQLISYLLDIDMLLDSNIRKEPLIDSDF